MTRLYSKILLLLAVLVAAGCADMQTQPGEEGDATSEVAAGIPLSEQPRLDPINRNYFVVDDPEQSVIGELQLVFAQEEDTFSDLAREYGLGYDELVAANPGIDPWLPGAETAIVLPTQYVIPEGPRSGIVLNIASKRLFYFPEAVADQPLVVMTYPIGIGRVGWETPLGETSVVSKARDPVWYVPTSVRKEHAEAGDPLPAVVPAGPDNPLGAHVLKLGLPGYLIHGTNQPYGVGMRVSHGCVRLYPENIELLYSLVGIGVDVRIISEPFLVGRLDGDLYFESHTPLEDDLVSPEQHLEDIFANVSEFESEETRQTISGIVGEARGIPVHLASVQSEEAFAVVRIVRNTVERNPDEPSLAEVRAMLDEETAEVADAEAVTAAADADEIVPESPAEPAAEEPAPATADEETEASAAEDAVAIEPVAANE